MTEKKLWEKMKKIIKAAGGVGIRIESHITPGFPDSIIVIGGKILLVELKVCTANSKIPIRKTQLAFAKMLAKHGVDVHVAVGTPDGIFVCRATQIDTRLPMKEHIFIDFTNFIEAQT